MVELKERNPGNSTKEGIMTKPQPSYTKEFKQEAVKLVETSNKTKSEIARDLGISDSALSKWCKEFGNHGEQAFPGKGHQKPLEEEVRRLQKENEVLRQERDILKKAVRIFAQPQQ
jgi:transposase